MAEAASSSDVYPADPPEDDVGPGEAEEVLPEVSLEVFNVIKSSQAQHGLRHGDYVRYRQYCSRRLHRVRKAVGFLHGKGRYVKKQLEPRMVKDSRFLLIPLYCAERAWAFAMALKREDVVAQPRLRFRLLHRLSKAAQWATGLAKLCAIRGDKRTALEAEAYAGFIVGNMHLERERWAQAISNFRRTKTICTELARVSMSDQAHLYTKVVAEVQPSIRFCAYNLRRTGEAEGEAEGDEDGDVEGMLQDEDGGSGSDILRSKLEAVRQESRARQAQDLTEVEVLGERVPVRSDKVRIAMLASQQKEVEIEHLSAPAGMPPPAGLMEKYDELFVAFNDALEGVRADLRAAAKEQTARSGAAESALLKLQASLTWQKLHHTVRRTLLLVESLKRSLAGDSGAGAQGAKRVAPDDIVRLYDACISSLGEMGQLEGYREDEVLMSQVAARLAGAKACRCFFLAESYGVATRYLEAQALYGRSEFLMQEAEAMLEEAGYTVETPERVALAKLEQMIDGARARAHAQAFVNTLTGGPAAAEAEGALASLELDGEGDVARAGERSLYDSLETFERPNPEHLIPFPPDFETTPCKPLLFDIARNQLTGPDLSARIKGGKSGSSWGSYLFGRS